MGSDAHVIVVGARADALAAARELVEELEARWSRFRPTSDVSVMNALAGRPVRVAPSTLALVERAIAGVAISGGRYDPTVLGAVISAGYDRSFERLDPADVPTDPMLRSGADEIRTDRSAGTVELPTAVGFDPGGIGKGFAADLVVERLMLDGAEGACVNLGGDVRVEGQAPDGGAWAVGIRDPFGPATTTVVGLRSGAVATSTRTRRTLGAPAARRHHLIDPSSGRPAWNGLASATVIAAEGWQAEVLAKAAFVAGPGAGIDLLERAGIDGLTVDDGGTVRCTAGFGRLSSRTIGSHGSSSRPL